MKVILVAEKVLSCANMKTSGKTTFPLSFVKSISSNVGGIIRILMSVQCFALERSRRVEHEKRQVHEGICQHNQKFVLVLCLFIIARHQLLGIVCT